MNKNMINEDFSASYTSSDPGYDTLNQGFSYRIMPLLFNLQQSDKKRKPLKRDKNIFKHYIGEFVKGISKYDNKEHIGKIISLEYNTESNTSEVLYANILDNKTNKIIPLLADTVKLINIEFINKKILDYFQKNQNMIIRENKAFDFNKSIYENYFKISNIENNNNYSNTITKLINRFDGLDIEGYLNEKECITYQKFFNNELKNQYYNYLTLDETLVDYYWDACGFSLEPKTAPWRKFEKNKILFQAFLDDLIYLLWKKHDKEDIYDNNMNIEPTTSYAIIPYKLSGKIYLNSLKDIKILIESYKECMHQYNIMKNNKFNIIGIKNALNDSLSHNILR